MKLHNILFLLMLHACVLPVRGDPPDAFKIMASRFNLLSFKMLEQKNDFFPNLAPEQKKGNAFLCSVIDANQPITARSIDPRPFLDHEIRAFATKNDYVLRCLVLYSYAPLKDVTVKCSDLSDADGHRISRDNIKIMRVGTAAGYPCGNFLIEPGIATAPPGSLVQYAVLLYAPETGPAGLYKGNITITSQERSVKLLVMFKVLDFALPEANISLGFCLPAHFHKKNPSWGEKWATDDYTADKVEAYFHFWKTRDLNSPSLFHAAPEFSEQGKDFNLTFATMDRVAAAMRQQQLSGYLILDMRFFSEWAEQAAKDPAIANGRSDIDLFKEMIRQLITHAEKNNWPRFLLFPEEEVSNGGEKITRYEKFWKPLREVAGEERDIILDNDIGYGRTHAIDRGARDGYKHRQYNSWEQSGIDNARKDHAEVWTYNLGFSRLSWGFALARYDSHGNHQWADKWGIPEYRHSFSTGNGVISSLQYETVHTGITDFRYIQKLKEKIAILRRTGNPQEAEKLAQLIGRQIQDIPLEGPRLGTLGITITDAELDIRRWLIAESLSPATANPTPPGKPEAYLTAMENHVESDNGQKMIVAAMASDDFTMDGKIQEPWWWKGYTGPLRMTLEAENYLKATVSSQAELQTKSMVSYSGAWVAYNQNGLLLGLSCNHTASQYVAKYQDDDADMWREDCMEFFFAPGDKHTYQLIVNPKGHKVMISTRGTIDSAPIKVTTVSPINPTGGHRQEILIPWQIFGLRTMPADGTLWKFNVGREFHSMNQLSCWTGVWGLQGGFLKFSGVGEYKYFKNMKIVPVYPGRNAISGEIVQLPRGNAALELTGKRGVLNSVALLDSKTNEFSFQFVNDPRQGNTQEYALTLKINGKMIEQYKCKAIAFDAPISCTAAKLQVFSGETIACDIALNISLPEIADNALQLGIIDRKGLPVWSTRKPFCASNVNRLWLNCAGLPPGDYKLQFGIVKNMNYFKKLEQIDLKIIPTPYQ